MRAASTLTVGLLLVMVQSVLLQLVPIHLPTPAFGLLVALHVGLSPRWTVFASVSLGFLLGYLFDLVSGTPSGTHALVYSVLALVAAMLGPRLSVRGFFLRAVVGLLVTMTGGLLVVAVRVLADSGARTGGFRLILLEAALTGAVAPAVLRLLDKLDGRLDAGRGEARMLHGSAQATRTDLELH